MNGAALLGGIGAGAEGTGAGSGGDGDVAGQPSTSMLRAQEKRGILQSRRDRGEGGDGCKIGDDVLPPVQFELLDDLYTVPVELILRVVAEPVEFRNINWTDAFGTITRSFVSHGGDTAFFSNASTCFFSASPKRSIFSMEVVRPIT